MVSAVRHLALAIAVLMAAYAPNAAAQNAPQPPRASVAIPELKTTGRTVRVPAGGDLQKALDEAKPGDRIELEPRATYQGPFRLKAKDGDDWIVITSAGALPKSGRHVQPSDAKSMAKLISAERKADILRRIPMGRLVEVDEVARMIAWLVSADCSFSTGAVFDLSGGRATY